MNQRNKWLLVCIALIGGVCVSGIRVVENAHNVRLLHTQLEDIRQRQDALLAEHSRLLLERGALSAYQKVEQNAQQRLAMHFPENVEPLVQKPTQHKRSRR